MKGTGCNAKLSLTSCGRRAYWRTSGIEAMFGFIYNNFLCSEKYIFSFAHNHVRQELFCKSEGGLHCVNCVFKIYFLEDNICILNIIDDITKQGS